MVCRSVNNLLFLNTCAIAYRLKNRETILSIPTCPPYIPAYNFVSFPVLDRSRLHNHSSLNTFEIVCRRVYTPTNSNNQMCRMNNSGILLRPRRLHRRFQPQTRRMEIRTRSEEQWGQNECYA